MKVCLYCQIGQSLDMAQFSIASAIKNAGLSTDEYKIVFLCWKTSQNVYDWLRKSNFDYVDMDYDEGKGFLWNLYKGWNLGYEVGYRYADYVCPIATDHAFYKNWLKNLVKYAQPNKVINCKLIEPGTLPTLHTSMNFGITTKDTFDIVSFTNYCDGIYQDTLVTNEPEYGHRFDAMPFLVSKDVWERFGPMNKWSVDGSPDPDGVYVNNITGDTDFFNRCKDGDVEVCKSLGSISYHCGGLETKINERKGIYT